MKSKNEAAEVAAEDVVTEVEKPVVRKKASVSPIGEVWPDHPWVALRPELAGRVYHCSDGDTYAVGTLHEPHNSTQKLVKYEGVVGGSDQGPITSAFWVDDPNVELRRE